MSSGRATSLEFSHYDAVPKNIAETVIKKAKVKVSCKLKKMTQKIRIKLKVIRSQPG
jgi:hypothetical protein